MIPERRAPHTTENANHSQWGRRQPRAANRNCPWTRGDAAAERRHREQHEERSRCHDQQPPIAQPVATCSVCTLLHRPPAPAPRARGGQHDGRGAEGAAARARARYDGPQGGARRPNYGARSRSTARRHSLSEPGAGGERSRSARATDIIYAAIDLWIFRPLYLGKCTHSCTEQMYTNLYPYWANNVHTAVLSKCTHCCTGTEQMYAQLSKCTHNTDFRSISTESSELDRLSVC